MKKAFLVLTSCALFACEQGAATKPAGAPQTPTKAPAAAAASTSKDITERLPPDHVVAKWKDGQLTYAELRDKAGPELRKVKNGFYDQLYQTEQQALDRQLVEMLVKKAAAAKGQTEEQFFEALTESAPVSDEEVKDFYEQRVKQTGRPFEEMKDNIKKYLKTFKSKDTISAELDRLKKEAAVEIDLPPPAVDRATFDLAGKPMKGKPDAKVTIVEFSDFQCPYCSRAVPQVKALIDAYPNDVKIYFLHFPLSFHEKAMPAALATQCAHEQGKFWLLHDQLFDNQASLSEEFVNESAKGIGLDMAKFEECVKNPKTKEIVDQDMAQGEAAGVEGTPTLFINGVRQQGVPSPEALKSFLNET